MKRKDYRMLWIGLKSAILISGKKRWSAKELVDAMSTLEISQMIANLEGSKK